MTCVDQQQAIMLLNHNNCDIVRSNKLSLLSTPNEVTFYFRDLEAVLLKKNEKKASRIKYCLTNKTSRYDQFSVECGEGSIEEIKAN